MTVFSCPSCRRVVAREDSPRHASKGSLTPLSGAKVEVRVGQAPRVRCVCGKLVVLLRGVL